MPCFFDSANDPSTFWTSTLDDSETAMLFDSANDPSTFWTSTLDDSETGIGFLKTTIE